MLHNFCIAFGKLMMHQTEAVLPKLMCLHIVIANHETNFPADQYGRTITGLRIYKKNLNITVFIIFSEITINS